MNKRKQTTGKPDLLRVNIDLYGEEKKKFEEIMRRKGYTEKKTFANDTFLKLLYCTKLDEILRLLDEDELKRKLAAL